VPVLHKSFESSNVKSANYFVDEQLLRISFKRKDGTVQDYVYKKVPFEVWMNLLAAPSVGSFVNKSIVPVYECRKGA
jgi:hypothetical protein